MIKYNSIQIILILAILAETIAANVTDVSINQIEDFLSDKFIDLLNQLNSTWKVCFFFVVLFNSNSLQKKFIFFQKNRLDVILIPK